MLEVSYSPLYVEAIAFHEAGHALLYLIFGVPVNSITIAEKCEEFRGLVRAAPVVEVPLFHMVLALLAAGDAEKLSPSHARFRTIKHFRIGRLNDLAHAFRLMIPFYQLARYSESTANRHFRRMTAEPLKAIMSHPANVRVVKSIAAKLIPARRLEGTDLDEFRSQVVLPGSARHPRIF